MKNTLTIEDCIDLNRIFGYVFIIEDGHIKQMIDHIKEKEMMIIASFN